MLYSAEQKRLYMAVSLSMEFRNASGVRAINQATRNRLHDACISARQIAAHLRLTARHRQNHLKFAQTYTVARLDSYRHLHFY